MKKLLCSAALTGLAMAAALPAHARDDKLMMPISVAMESPETKEKLDSSIRYYFGNQKTPKVLKKLGTDASNKKTNAFGKSDEKACQWAFLSAMLSLEQRAKELGANAVVNIVSNYKKVVMSSDTDYECHAGGIMAGVALKGDFVKIADK
ncbi:MAG TPA: excinuclease ATPase subunit [Oxalicibacterium sp.]|uniref:excinuclease ATPase subunit n=1 Tax=Oxalicibacterium sp. TaxID=2766525 RepID=UPI002B522860|nr:excinuclease ATPase subunit [Oxalicibacterium sp.]HWU97909.1 excinuclease ATPase subunit [Oxalicibacterium sp.]